MNTYEFVEKVEKKQIKNGNKYNVYNGDTLLGVVAVIDSKVIYLDSDNLPMDLLTNDVYLFTEIKES